MIVVDANIVAYYFIEGEKTRLARELMRHDSDWRVPPLWRHEYLNVLATYARQGGATLEQVRGLWRRALEVFGARERSADHEAALALAISHPISACDGQYVALAQQLGVVFVTEDRRLLKAFPTVARNLQALAESRAAEQRTDEQ